MSRRTAATWGVCIGAALVAALALNMVWWALLSPEAQVDDEVTIVIPEGTAASVAGGGSSVFIRPSLELSPAGTLRIVNNDTVEHTVGDYKIAPGESKAITAPEASAQFNCSISSSGFLGFHILRRPPILSTIMPSVLLGAPLGAVLAIAILVASKLGHDTGPGPRVQHIVN